MNRGKSGPVSQGFGDGHEKVAMGISPDGFIHLAFDHHLSTFHYRRNGIVLFMCVRDNVLADQISNAPVISDRMRNHKSQG